MATDNGVRGCHQATDSGTLPVWKIVKKTFNFTSILHCTSKLLHDYAYQEIVFKNRMENVLN